MKGGRRPRQPKMKPRTGPHSQLNVTHVTPYPPGPPLHGLLSQTRRCLWQCMQFLAFVWSYRARSNSLGYITDSSFHLCSLPHHVHTIDGFFAQRTWRISCGAASTLIIPRSLLGTPAASRASLISPNFKCKSRA